MKTVVFNKDNLTEEEIDRVLGKVRAVVLNSQGQVLLCKYAGLYMLPGGSIDEGETEQEALAREIYEESGITLAQNQAEKFLEIKSLDRNYYDRKAKQNINRMTNTSFYVVHTNMDINLGERKLTESEQSKGFEMFFTNLSKVEYLVSTNNTTNPKKANFDRELLTVIREYASFKNKESKDEEER